MNRHTIVLSTLVATAFAAPWAAAQTKTLSIDAPHVQLTMAQAVVIAESMGNGRATGARLEDRDGQPVYRVTVKAPGEQALKLQVAATDGRIVASERGRDER